MWYQYSIIIYSIPLTQGKYCNTTTFGVKAVVLHSITGPAELFPSGSHLDLWTSVSPLKYQSMPGEDEPGGAQRNDRVALMDVDPVDVEQDNLQLSMSLADPHPPAPKTKVYPCLFQTKLC